MKYVVLGASAAGINGVRQLRANDPQGEIMLISADKEIYSRCILHHYLGDIRTKEQLSFVEPNFEELYKVQWKKGVSCTGLDEKAKTVSLSDGSTAAYDKLLIATGSHAIRLPIAGLADAKGVYLFRDIQDLEEIRTNVANAQNIVVLGGGLSGVDAIAGLLERGKTCTLVELEDRVLAKQLDHYAAGVYAAAMEKSGVKLYFETSVSKVETHGDGKVKALQLSSGASIPCDMLILTVGVKSNVDFLAGTGIVCDQHGLVIDPHGQTSNPYVYGAGDVTGRSPIWPAAVKEGMIAADNMCGKPAAMENFFASKSTMNFLGIPTMALGVPVCPDHTYSQLVEKKDGQYRMVIHKDGKIHGAILQGDLSYGGVLTQLIAYKIDVSRVKKPLFEIDYSDFFHEKNNFEFFYEVS